MNNILIYTTYFNGAKTKYIIRNPLYNLHDGENQTLALRCLFMII